MEFSHEMLAESKTARSAIVLKKTQEEATDVLSKAKALVFFASIKSTGYATTEQVATYFGVLRNTVEQLFYRNKEEFSNEVKLLSGKALKDVTDKMSVTSKAPKMLAWTPRAMLRTGMMLTQSEVAREVRNVLLNNNESSSVKPLTQQDWDDYHEHKTRLKFVRRLIDRMELKKQFINLFDFVGEWKQSHPEEFFDEQGVLRSQKWENYEASIVNSAYSRVLGGNKKKICETKEIPYRKEETIRDHLPLEAMQAMLGFEAIMHTLVVTVKMKPHLALDLAANGLQERPINSFALPLAWERDISIACPPSLTASEFLQRYRSEELTIQETLGGYENRLAQIKQLGGAK